MKRTPIIILLVSTAIVSYGFLGSLRKQHNRTGDRLECNLVFTTDRTQVVAGSQLLVNLVGNETNSARIIEVSAGNAMPGAHQVAMSFIGSHTETYDWRRNTYQIRDGEFALMDNYGNQLWGYYYGKAEGDGQVFGIIVRGVGKYSRKSGTIKLTLRNYTDNPGELVGNIIIEIQDREST